MIEILLVLMSSDLLLPVYLSELVVFLLSLLLRPFISGAAGLLMPVLIRFESEHATAVLAHLGLLLSVGHHVVEDAAVFLGVVRTQRALVDSVHLVRLRVDRVSDVEQKVAILISVVHYLGLFLGLHFFLGLFLNPFL